LWPRKEEEEREKEERRCQSVKRKGNKEELGETIT
jgi:hypothetical protein